MPTAVKTAENMTKHLTRDERKIREQAEADVMPDRGREPKLKKPKFVARDKTANSYWNQILRRMEGLALLDDLDSEMLAGYCSMLARRDQTLLLVGQLMNRLGIQDAVEAGVARRKRDSSAMTDQEWEESARRSESEMTPDELVEAMSKLDSLNRKLQTLEKTLLTYADKLGLTPSGRVRLAQKRAVQAAQASQEDDLFGD